MADGEGGALSDDNDDDDDDDDGEGGEGGGSDAAAASAFTRIEVMGLRWLNLCLLPVVVLWIFVSWYLGRKQEYMAGMDGSQSRD